METTHITNEYIKASLDNDLAVMFGFRWTSPKANRDGSVTLEISGFHKVVVSGYRTGPYPLRINDIFDDRQQWVRLIRFKDSTRPFDSAGGTGKATTPESMSQLNSSFYLEFEGHTAPNDDVCVVTQIDAISLNWRPPQRSLTWHWGTGWTHFAPFTVAGASHFLAYNTATGDIHLDKFIPDGSQGIWSGKLAIGWTTLMPFTHQQTPHFVAYNSHTGAVQFYRTSANLQGLDSVWAGLWGKGFTHFHPFEIDSVAHFIAYNANSGLVHFDRINASLMGSSTRFEANWATGWSAFMPFVLEERPHFVAYNTSSGEVHLDRISQQGGLS